MKKRFMAVLICLIMLVLEINSALADAEFPFGLTGYETLEECADVLSDIFGDGKNVSIDGNQTFLISECDDDFYGMSIKSVCAHKSKDDKDDFCDMVSIDLVDNANATGYEHLLELVVYLVDSYGIRDDSKPIRRKVNLNGAKTYYTMEEELEQIREAIMGYKPFEYEAVWLSPYDELDYMVWFTLDVTGNGGNKFKTELSWVMLHR